MYKTEYQSAMQKYTTSQMLNIVSLEGCAVSPLMYLATLRM